MKTPDPSATAFQVTYLEHFALTEKPFGITPDPDFFFESHSHSEAVRRLESFLREREGIALIYGGVGTGKTLICRRFLDGLDKNRFNAVHIINPLMDGLELLFEIAGQFNLTPPPSSTREDVLLALRDFLLAEHKKGRASVLVIDEAQLLSNDALALLMELSHLETDNEGMLHTILFGQKEIATGLLDQSMGELRRHITVTHYLEPLSLQEVGPYIRHRLSKAGSNGSISFSKDALKCVYTASKGCPRIINRICDQSLLLLSRQSKTTVDKSILNRVLRNEIAALLTMHERPKLFVRILYTIALILATVLIFYGLLFYLRPALGCADMNGADQHPGARYRLSLSEFLL
jgi:type II secretory pathway predicted ATPase ExeA